MRKPLKIIGIVSLVLISFAAGTIMAVVFHLGSPIVTVQLENASEKEITSLRISHEHGIVELKNIEAGGSRTVHFYAPGDSSYELSLVFANGQTLQSGPTYVEPGYSVTAVITEHEIKSQ